MENVDFTIEPNEFRINGIPDAHQVASLDTPQAKRLADMAAHRIDLFFVLECLKELDGKAYEPNSIVQNALWNSAIVHYVKCFGGGHGARGQLSAHKILKTEPVEAMRCHGFFERLRNKHVVHDDQAWSSFMPMAVINNGRKSYKIEKIICSSVEGVHFDIANYGNLRLLTEIALKWVEKEFDALAVNLTSFLETLSFAELTAMPPPQYTVPDYSK